MKCSTCNLPVLSLGHVPGCPFYEVRANELPARGPAEEAAARADAMEALVREGVDAEDAAVVSGAEIVLVETADGATMKPVRAPAAWKVPLVLGGATVAEIRTICLANNLATTGSRAALIDRLRVEFQEAAAWEARKANLPPLPVGYRIIFDGGTEMPIALEHRPLDDSRMMFYRAVYAVPAPVQTTVVYEDFATASSVDAALSNVRRNVGGNYPVAEFLAPGQKTRAELEAEVAKLRSEAAQDAETTRALFAAVAERDRWCDERDAEIAMLRVVVDAALHEREARAAWLASLPAGSCGNPPSEALLDAEKATGEALAACGALTGGAPHAHG